MFKGHYHGDLAEFFIKAVLNVSLSTSARTQAVRKRS